MAMKNRAVKAKIVAQRIERLSIKKKKADRADVAIVCTPLDE